MALFVCDTLINNVDQHSNRHAHTLSHPGLVLLAGIVHDIFQMLFTAGRLRQLPI